MCNAIEFDGHFYGHVIRQKASKGQKEMASDTKEIVCCNQCKKSINFFLEIPQSQMYTQNQVRRDLHHE